MFSSSSMDGLELTVITIGFSSIAAVLGFGMRALWDNVSLVRENKRQKRLSHVEFLLSDFYVPIHMLLKREQAIWDKLIALHRSGWTDVMRKLDDATLENHKNVQKYILENVSKADPREDIMRQLMAYDEHVTMYQALRDVGSDAYPITVGCPYPVGLIQLLAVRIQELEVERHRLVGLCPSAKCCLTPCVRVVDVHSPNTIGELEIGGNSV